MLLLSPIPGRTWEMGDRNTPVQDGTDIQAVMSNSLQYYAVNDNDLVCSLGYSKETGKVFAQVFVMTFNIGPMT